MQTAVSQPRSLVGFSFADTISGRIVLCLAATLVVAAAAHVSIPLWFTPVPLTLQPLAVLAVGLALGPRLGFFALLAYLAEGAAGLPVFSPIVGVNGVAHLVGPTGGFLMAYPLVAAIAGCARLLVARMPRFPAALVASSLASLVLFASGAGWFMQYTHHSVSAAWNLAVYPFLTGAVINICVSSGAYGMLRRPSRQ